MVLSVSHAAASTVDVGHGVEGVGEPTERHPNRDVGVQARGPARDALLTVDEVALALRVSAQFVYRHASDGDLPAVNIGTVVRIKESVVKAIIEGTLVLGRPRPSGGRRGQGRGLPR